MNDDVIANMRARVATCRRLASSTQDARTANILRSMADEIESDIRRIEAERTNRPERD